MAFPFLVVRLTASTEFVPIGAKFFEEFFAEGSQRKYHYRRAAFAFDQRYVREACVLESRQQQVQFTFDDQLDSFILQ